MEEAREILPMTNGRPDPLDLRTITEACEILSVSRRFLYDEIAADKLQIVHLGRSTRIPYAELERYVAERTGTLAPVLHLNRKG